MAMTLIVLIGSFGVTIADGSARQEVTATHPLVGTWIVDPEVDDLTNPPSFDAFMADGTLVNIGSDGASVGSWESTGPQTASMTFAGPIQGDESGALFILRADLTVSEDGETLSGTHSFTIVAPDGSVVAAFEGGSASGVRLHAEPMASGGQGIPGFEGWQPEVPASPAS
ncbi:MAG TPA: hypothetical protein VD767_07400 [Thermomicrobiales bacterium]|nr:hypothetical protein [Thermomicrobiales bacterium]